MRSARAAALSHARRAKARTQPQRARAWATHAFPRRRQDPERAFGRESRSLKAAYELLEAGFKDLAHLEGGTSTWRYEGLPLSTD